MNSLNALIFALMGTVMEILPLVFPSWFPKTCGDQSSSRALWMCLMGGMQISLGAGFVLRAHVLPVFVRVVSSDRQGGAVSLPLPSARAVVVR
jgi:hypothetical protein